MYFNLLEKAQLFLAALLFLCSFFIGARGLYLVMGSGIGTGLMATALAAVLSVGKVLGMILYRDFPTSGYFNPENEGTWTYPRGLRFFTQGFRAVLFVFSFLITLVFMAALTDQGDENLNHVTNILVHRLNDFAPWEISSRQITLIFAILIGGLMELGTVVIFGHIALISQPLLRREAYIAHLLREYRAGLNGEFTQIRMRCQWLFQRLRIWLL